MTILISYVIQEMSFSFIGNLLYTHVTENFRDNYLQTYLQNKDLFLPFFIFTNVKIYKNKNFIYSSKILSTLKTQDV